MGWYYKNSDDNKLRFVLGLQEADFLSKNSIICIGVNPSTATPENPDPTIRNVAKLAKNNGYDNFYMFNLYPQRARDIKMMDKELDLERHEQNMQWYRSVIGQYHSMHNTGIDIWCAWGNLIDSRDYLRNICLRDIFQIISEYGCDTFSVGQVSKDGNPHHPLYIKTDTAKCPYELTHYFN